MLYRKQNAVQLADDDDNDDDEEMIGMATETGYSYYGWDVEFAKTPDKFWGGVS